MSKIVEFKMGIGWVRDPDKPNWLINASISDYIEEIQRLQQQLDKARVALAPFAKAGELFGPRDTNGYNELIYNPAAGDAYCITGDDLRVAKHALAIDDVGKEVGRVAVQRRERRMDSIEKRAARWAATADTGVSSLAILSMMTGVQPTSRFCYPHDGSDLGRCIGLLNAVPEYRERLAEMKVVGPEWSALVDHWPELEAMHRAGGGRLYDRMKSILDPIEATNRDLVKPGKGSGVYFGD